MYEKWTEKHVQYQTAKEDTWRANIEKETCTVLYVKQIDGSGRPFGLGAQVFASGSSGSLVWSLGVLAGWSPDTVRRGWYHTIYELSPKRLLGAIARSGSRLGGSVRGNILASHYQGVLPCDAAEHITRWAANRAHSAAICGRFGRSALSGRWGGFRVLRHSMIGSDDRNVSVAMENQSTMSLAFKEASAERSTVRQIERVSNLLPQDSRGNKAFCALGRRQRMETPLVIRHTVATEGTMDTSSSKEPKQTKKLPEGRLRPNGTASTVRGRTLIACPDTKLLR